jgi:hypothetical protein
MIVVVAAARGKSSVVFTSTVNEMFSNQSVSSQLEFGSE